MIDQLKEAARKATPGPWEALDDVMGGNFVMEPDGGDPIAETERPRDMRYIALASPEVILDLIQKYEEVTKALIEAKKLLDIFMSAHYQEIWEDEIAIINAALPAPPNECPEEKV